jgi:NADPH-dependent 2,4-dienoyl-CoA reductase/sulfur reductase-like enzyme
MRYLIIGGSIAGLSCATKLRQLEPRSEVTVLSEEDKPYAKMALPYLLTGERDLRLAVPEGVEFLGNRKAGEVVPDERKVITKDGTPFAFDKLLIASGAGASVPELEGSGSSAVFTVRDLSDIQGIQGLLGKARQKKVIISGAGLVSMEMGDAVAKLGFTPVFLISSHRVFSMILDDPGSEVLTGDLAAKGAEVHFGESIKGVETRNEGVLVETQSGKEFTGDLVIIGKGAVPNTAFLASSGIEVDRGVMVDEFLETNSQGIFAAGDVCQGYDLVYGDKRVNALWPVAIEQGIHAAMNMTHFRIPYRGSVARNIVTAFGNTVFTAGLSRNEDLEIYRREGPRRYSKIVLRDGRLVGAIFINMRIDPGAYLFAMERQGEVSRLKEAMLSGSLSYTYLLPFLRGSMRFEDKDRPDQSGC